MTSDTGNAATRAALVIVDIQDVFLNVMPNRDELLSRCCFAVEAARLLGLQVVFTAQLPEKLGGLNSRLAALAPQARFFGKNSFSAFRCEDFNDLIDRLDIDHLLIGGLETPICIYQTALDALHDAFDVTLLTDCIGCRRMDDGEAVKNYLRQVGDCHLLPSEAVFYSILGSADAPQFRDFTRLVKKYTPSGG